MSETEAKSPTDPKILEQAAAWLTRLQSGRVTPATLEELETWRVQSEEHRTVWARAQAVLADFEQVPPGLGRDTLQRAHSERRRAVKALALVFVAVPLGWGGYRRLPVPVREWQADYKTFKGEQKSIALSDGTQLDLNTSSAVNRVFSKNEHRIVLLAGEIRITTGAHSAARPQPLVVATAQGLMRPIGTRFSVRQLESETRLAVFAGRVAATTAVSRQTLIVEAGQQAGLALKVLLHVIGGVIFEHLDGHHGEVLALHQIGCLRLPVRPNFQTLNTPSRTVYRHVQAF